MISAAERAPAALLGPDRSVGSIGTADLAATGGTAATFDLHLATAPALGVGATVPVVDPLAGGAPDQWIRAEAPRVSGDSSPIGLDAAVAPTQVLSLIGQPLPVQPPLSSDPTTAPAPASGSGTPPEAILPTTIADAAIVPIGSEQAGATVAAPSILHAAAAAVSAPAATDITGAVQALAVAIQTLSGNVGGQAPEVGAAALVAVQSGLAQLVEDGQRTLDTINGHVQTLLADVGEDASAAASHLGSASTAVLEGTTQAAADAAGSLTDLVGTATQATAELADDLDDALLGGDPPAGIVTLMGLLDPAEAFEIADTAGQTIFAGAGAASAITDDLAAVASAGDGAIALLDHLAADAPAALHDTTHGLLGDLGWDHHG